MSKDNSSSNRRLFLKAALGTVAAAGAVSTGIPMAIASKSSNNQECKPTTNQYTFDIAEQKVAPDGVDVDALLVNQKLPGETIRVKEGELLRVTCKNHLKTPTTIHWHGLILPNPMDGVPKLTQRPIMPGEIFVYEFPLIQTGTYWYHSHFQLQEQIGLNGPFIIEPQKERLSYDKEYVIMLSDWLHQSPYAVLEQLKHPKKMDMSGKPDLADIDYPSFLLNGQSTKNPWQCSAKPGDVLRLRIINGSASSYFWFLIDDHELEIVEIDGQPVKSIKTQRILMATAERYDVLVRVKNSGKFAIRAIVQTLQGQALGELSVGSEKSTISHSVPNIQSLQSFTDATQAMCLEPSPIPDGPVRRYDLTLDGNMKKYQWSMGGEVYPNAEPLICSPGERVHVKMVNKTGMYHPMHVHGHFVRAVNHIPIESSAKLDIISVPPHQTREFIFYADNPGRWFFHCHNLYHLDTGMAREIHYMLS